MKRLNQAVETGEIAWTELYVDAATGELMVTCSKPVYGPEGEIVGVVGADVTLKTMNEGILNTENTLIGILIAMILAVSGMSFLLSRLITNPVKKLTKGSEAIGKGNLDCRVEVRTGDELEDLANSLNKMASDLKRYMNELVEKEARIRELEIERLEKYSKNLERKVKILEIKIDNEKTKKAIPKITETEYFKKLREDLQMRTRESRVNNPQIALEGHRDENPLFSYFAHSSPFKTTPPSTPRISAPSNSFVPQSKCCSGCVPGVISQLSTIRSPAETTILRRADAGCFLGSTINGEFTSLIMYSTHLNPFTICSSVPKPEATSSSSGPIANIISDSGVSTKNCL